MEFTEQTLQNLISYWAGKLNLLLPAFRRDNRMVWSAHIHKCNCGYYIFTYNYKRIKTYSHPSLMSIIFHELGHIKYYKKQYKLDINKEYYAERFAIDCIKKYYPDYLEQINKDTKELLKDKQWCKKFPIYVKVFKKIKEYN